MTPVPWGLLFESTSPSYVPSASFRVLAGFAALDFEEPDKTILYSFFSVLFKIVAYIVLPAPDALEELSTLFSFMLSEAF